MPKNATTMQARRKSLCPECGKNIRSGQTIKVYSDEWFHLYPCWNDMWKTIIAKRDYEDYQDMDKYKNKPKIRIKPIIEDIPDDDNQLELNMKKEVDKYEASFKAISDAIDEIVDLEGTLSDQRLRLKITIQKLKENWRL